MLRVITTMYSGTCAETGKVVARGEKALYDCRTGKLYGCGTVAMAKFIRSGELPFVEPTPVVIKIVIDGVNYDMGVKEGDVIRITSMTAHRVESTNPQKP